jgi:hypothetical protein
MRVFATLSLSAALGVVLVGTAGADTPTCPRNKDCKSTEARELKSESLHGMVTRPEVPGGWKQQGIAINPWIVPTFR